MDDVLAISRHSLLENLALHWLTILAASVVTVLLYFYATSQSRKLQAAYGAIPGPKPLPFLGNFIDALKVKGMIHLQLQEYCKIYGKVFPFYFINCPALVISDPEMIKQIMVKDFDCFCDRPVLIKLPEPLASMVSVVSGGRWKQIRNTLSPTFSAHKMKQMAPLMNTACDTLLVKMKDAAHTGESFDIVNWLQCLTLDVIISTAFGIQSDSQRNPGDTVVTKARDAMNFGNTRRVVLMVVGLLPGSRFILDSISTWLFKSFEPLAEIAENIIAARREGGESARKDMLNLMLNAEIPGTSEKKLTDQEIASQCVVFLLAGYETSSFTLSMVCYHLATNQDVQDKLRQEIDSVWTDEDKMPSYETVHELPYLDMVISETLRLYPPAVTLSRQCTKECFVKGIKIPVDTSILVPVFSIHRDPAIWPDPEKFDPERFSPEAKQTRDPYVYLPFGIGPRNCVGMRFAQMEMKLVLARILKKYRLEVAPDTKIPPALALNTTLTVKGGIKLKISCRT